MQHSDTLAAEVQIPDLTRALQYQNENSLRQCKDGEYSLFPYLTTSISEFAAFGVGLQLYFHFLKCSAGLFFLISLVSIWPIVVHSQGSGIKDDVDKEHAYQAITLANEDTDSITDKKIQIICADLVYTGIFIIFLLFYRISAGRIISQYQRKMRKISTYAITVKKLPEECTENEVELHFQQFGVVRQVHLARKFHDKLYDYRKRTELSYNLGIAQNKAKLKNKVTNNTIKLLKMRIKKFDEKIKKQEKEDLRPYEKLPVDRAYVVFERIEDRNSCLKQYKKEKKWWRSALYQRSELQFQGKHPLHVKPAPEPSLILWENLELTLFQKGIRVIIIAFITLLLLIGTIVLLFWLKSRESGLPHSLKCRSDGFVSSTQYSPNFVTEYQINCYCLTRSMSKIIDGKEVCDEYNNCVKLDDFCEEFLDKWTAALYTKIITSIGIIFINFCLLIVLKLLTAIERPPSLDKMKQSLLKKVFVAMFVNTTIITVLVNADFQSYVKAYGLFDGNYSDFTQSWYLYVGSTIIITLFINIFSPHCANLIIFRTIRKCLRFCCWKNAKSQQALNALFIGPEFDLAVKYAIILNLIFSCFLYSGGIPLLNCFCFCGLFVIYWTDKYLILRYYRKPPVYNETLNTQAVNYLPLCVIFHCAFALYMYGADGEMMPDDTPLEERIVSASGLLMILYMIVTVGVGFFSWIVVEIYYCVRRIRKKKEEKPSYTESIENIKRHSLASYDILDNEVYAPLIRAMKSTLRGDQTPPESASPVELEDSKLNIEVEDELHSDEDVSASEKVDIERADDPTK